MSPEPEISVLLAAPDSVKADLARSLLEAAGIPSLLHGPDMDMAELGVAAHAGFTRPDLLVPTAALETARELLEEAWGVGALDT